MRREPGVAFNGKPFTIWTWTRSSATSSGPFCYAKQHRLDDIADGLDEAGDVWTWVAIEADTKLVLAYRVDDRTYRACKKFMRDLYHRINYDEDLEIFTDGNPSYVRAIKRYFGTEISYSQLVKTHHGDDSKSRIAKSSAIARATKPIPHSSNGST